MKKERIVNIRFLFCIFIGLMLGIIFSKLFLLGNINLFVYLSFLLIICSIAVGLVIYAKKTAQENKKFYARKNVSFLLLCSAIGFAIAYLVGLIIAIFPIVHIKDNHQFSGSVNVTGIVSGYIDKESTYTKFLLSDCEYFEDGTEVFSDFGMVVYTGTLIDVELGDEVSFSAELDNFEYSDEYDFSLLGEKISYSAYIDLEDITVNAGHMNFRDKVHRYVNNVLKDNLNEDNAEISFAVLFGQKYGLSKDISEMFSYAGISHILAVSGLHIGVLVTLIWFVLSKCKVNKYVRLVLFGLILIFYSYLCMFSPSVCRASIMAFVLAMCKCFFWEYDILSSLSIAGIIILLVDPLALFTVSFQLSFMCIFAIITFAPALNKLFDKIKVPKFLASSLAVSIAVNIAILPICMNYFAKVGLLGVITNIFVLPIFSATYILLFVSTLIAVLIQSLGFVLAIPNLLLHIIKVVAFEVTSIPYGLFKLFRVSYIIVFLLGLIFLTIHFFMSKKLFKMIWVGILSVLACVLCIVYVVPKNYDSDNLIVAKQYKSNVVMYVGESGITMIGSDISYNNVLFLMRDVRLNRIDTIVAYDLQLNKVDELLKIKQEFGVEKIVLTSKYDYEGLTNKLGKVEFFDKTYNIDNLKLYTIEYKYDIVALDIEVNGTDFLVPFLSNSINENNYLINNFYNFDYYLISKISIWNEQDNITGEIINLTETNKCIFK